jgi:hypothetical protein
MAEIDKLRSRLKKLIKRPRNFAARRNEIAHGIVREWWGGRGRDATLFGYALFPADYNARKWELPEAGEAFSPYHPLGFSAYISTSAEIDRYAVGFSSFALEARALGERFIGAFPLPQFTGQIPN